METKKIATYFKQTQQVPLAMSLVEVKSLVQLKGAAGPPNKSWWNMNNLLIMTTTTLCIALASYWLSNAPLQNQPTNTSESNTIPEVVLDTFGITFIEHEAEEEANSSMNIPADQTTDEEVITLASIDSMIVLHHAEVEFDKAIAHQEEKQHQTIEAFENESLEADTVLPIIEGTTKTISKSIALSVANILVLEGRKADINVENWDQDKVEVTAIFKLDANNDEDIKRGLADFDFDLEVSGNKILAETSWDGVDYCRCSSSKSKGKTKTKNGSRKVWKFNSSGNVIKLGGGDKININGFSIGYLVKLPKKMHLDLTNRYANITTQDVAGDLNVTVFKGALKAGNVDGNLKLSAKYGSALVGNFNRGNAVLFKANGTFGDSEKFDLKVNYSEIKMGASKALNLTAFKSDLIVDGAIERLQGTVKYGDLELNQDAIAIELSAFKAKVRTANIERASVHLSYSAFKANKMVELTIENAFQSNLSIEELSIVSGDLKYSPFYIGALQQSIDISMFKEKLSIDDVQPSFQRMDLNTKYTDVDVTFDPTLKYELDAEMAYTQFKVSEKIMSIQYQNGASTHHNRFTGKVNSDQSGKPAYVNVNSFQGHLRLH